METIVFDESGNTGASLVDQRQMQPVYTLASTNYTNDEAADLLNILGFKHGQEIKFKNIKKQVKKYDNIIKFMQKIVTDKRSIVTVYHKEFVLITQIVDLIIESEFHDQGIDIYKNGLNLALANMHYMSVKTLCDKNVSFNFMKSFELMIRENTKGTRDNFFYWLWQVHGTCLNSSYHDLLEPIIQSEINIKKILELLDAKSIDPAISSFAVHCSIWTDKSNGKFNIIHDNSKPIFESKEYLESLMDTKVESRKIGYDKRMFSFPYNATGIEFCDSKDDLRLQIVDVIAGCIATWANGVADENMKNELWYKINESQVYLCLTQGVWPSELVTPVELGCESNTGNNAIDMVASYIMNKRKN